MSEERSGRRVREIALQKFADHSSLRERGAPAPCAPLGRRQVVGQDDGAPQAVPRLHGVHEMGVFADDERPSGRVQP